MSDKKVKFQIIEGLDASNSYVAEIYGEDGQNQIARYEYGKGSDFESESLEPYEMDDLKLELVKACETNNNMLIAGKLNYLVNKMDFEEFVEYMYDVAREGKNERLFEVLMDYLDNDSNSLGERFYDDDYEVLRDFFCRVCLKKIDSQDIGMALKTIERYLEKKRINKEECSKYIASVAIDVELDIAKYIGKRRCSLVFYAIRKGCYDLAGYLFNLGASNMSYSEIKVAISIICHSDRKKEAIELGKLLNDYIDGEIDVDTGKRKRFSDNQKLGLTAFMIEDYSMLECVKNASGKNAQLVEVLRPHFTKEKIIGLLRAEFERVRLSSCRSALNLKRFKDIIEITEIFFKDDKAFVREVINSNVDGYTMLSIVCEKYESYREGCADKDVLSLKEFIKFLVDNGANVNSANNLNNDTPLIIACRRLKKDIVDILLEYVDVNLENVEEETALSVVCQLSRYYNAIPIAKALIDNGANVNKPKSKPLINACKSGNGEMIEFLTKMGAKTYNLDEGTKKVLEEKIKELKLERKKEKEKNDKIMKDEIKKAIEDINCKAKMFIKNNDIDAINEEQLKACIKRYLTFSTNECNDIFRECKEMSDIMQNLRYEDLSTLEKKIKIAMINQNDSLIFDNEVFDDIYDRYQRILNKVKKLSDKDFYDFKDDVSDRRKFFARLRKKSCLEDLKHEYNKAKENMEIAQYYVDELKSSKARFPKYRIVTDKKEVEKIIKGIDEDDKPEDIEKNYEDMSKRLKVRKIFYKKLASIILLIRGNYRGNSLLYEFVQGESIKRERKNGREFGTLYNVVNIARRKRDKKKAENKSQSKENYNFRKSPVQRIQREEFMDQNRDEKKKIDFLRNW